MRDAYQIRTPENVTFEFELAGLAARAVAFAVDLLVMFALLMIVSLLLNAVGQLAGEIAQALGFIAAFLIFWGYGTLAEWLAHGRTVGKFLVGLRTLSNRGLRIGFGQAVVRNLLRPVDALPAFFLVGGLTALVDPYRRRLGDLAAGTIVVRERRAPAPSAVVPASERYNTFVDDPAIAMAVRRITAPERDAMVGLSLRREQLPLPVRRELFARLAGHLQERLGVPRPPFFSEEKYVLNLTAVALGQGDRRPR